MDDREQNIVALCFLAVAIFALGYIIVSLGFIDGIVNTVNGWMGRPAHTEITEKQAIINDYQTYTTASGGLAKSTKVPCQPVSGASSSYKGGYGLINCPFDGQTTYYCDNAVVSKEAYLTCEE